MTTSRCRLCGALCRCAPYERSFEGHYLTTAEQPAIERASIDVDIACVGFGPATGGFLTTLSRQLLNDDGTPAIESKAAPGMPLQVICYERADDIGFGVSGVVTRARGIRASFPDLDPAQIPMAAAGCQREGGVPARSGGRQPALARSASRRSLPAGVRQDSGRCSRRVRTALHAEFPPQERWAGAFHRPVQPVGGLAIDVERRGANLAGNAGGRGTHRGRQGRWVCAWSIRVWTARETRSPASRPEWIYARRSPSSEMGRSERSVMTSTSASELPRATKSASGRSA